MRPPDVGVSFQPCRERFGTAAAADWADLSGHAAEDAVSGRDVEVGVGVGVEQRSPGLGPRPHRTRATVPTVRSMTREQTLMTKAVVPGLGACLALALAGCSPRPEAGTSLTVQRVEADEAGVVVADAWPDACELGPGRRTGATEVRPEPGALPDGTELPGARSCTWDESLTPRSLRVVLVSTDVQEAWAGYQYTLPLRRPVSEIGDEAFLNPLPGGEEELWVCNGLTIFTVTARDLPQEQAREAMFDIAAEAVAALEGTRAGSVPPPLP